MDKYSYIANAHGNYIDELYKSFKQDPSAVDESWQRFFEGFEFSLEKYGESPTEVELAETEGSIDSALSSKETKVRNLIHAYRTRGHLEANTNPVRKRRDHKALLSIADHGLTEADLDTEFEVGAVIGIGKASLHKILASLRTIYAGAIGFEFMYIREPEILSWFRDKLERESLSFKLSKKDKERILWKLNEAVVFENFLHTKYIGQKVTL